MSNSAEEKREPEFSPPRRRETFPDHVKSICASANGLNRDNVNKKPACYSEENEAVDFFGDRKSSAVMKFSSITG